MSCNKKDKLVRVKKECYDKRDLTKVKVVKEKKHYRKRRNSKSRSHSRSRSRSRSHSRPRSHSRSRSRSHSRSRSGRRRSSSSSSEVYKRVDDKLTLKCNEFIFGLVSDECGYAVVVNGELRKSIELEVGQTYKFVYPPQCVGEYCIYFSCETDDCGNCPPPLTGTPEMLGGYYLYKPCLDGKFYYVVKGIQGAGGCVTVTDPCKPKKKKGDCGCKQEDNPICPKCPKEKCCDKVKKNWDNDNYGPKGNFRGRKQGGWKGPQVHNNNYNH